MLADQVKAGKLPPVEKRLPAKPRVLDLGETGTFGGTWHRAYKGRAIAGGQPSFWKSAR